MPAAAGAIKAAILAAFQDINNSLGPNITKVTVVEAVPGSLPVATPTVGVAYVDPKLAAAIAGAVADGIAKFLP